MGMFTCPKGHQSSEPDFCSECGAKIQGAPSGQTPSPPPVAAAIAGCPDCGAARSPDGGIFCEVCGYNFSTGARGQVPVPAPASPAAPDHPTAGWTVLISVDPTLREPDSPEPPAGVGPFAINLEKPVSMIGRRSDSRAIFPEIPLNYDDAVSHRHALLQRRDDGTLVLRDIGAANGTRLNGKDVEPLTDNPLRDADEITLGHWTRIVVKAIP
ncbi:MAG: FHA domain-containing protein [Bryobacteraceae bacterium]